MKTNLKTVDLILDAKREVACDRDLLRNMLRYLKERIARLDASYKRKRHNSTKRKIKAYRAIAGSIVQSIEAAHTLLKSPSDYSILKVFRTIFNFLVDRICTIKKASDIFEHKFRGIYAKFGEMVIHATELKNLLRA